MFLIGLLSAFCAILYGVPVFVLAQELDLNDLIDQTAPTIFHIPRDGEVLPGRGIEVKAIIADDRKVTAASLFYRRGGDELFIPLDMEKREAEVYRAVVPASDVIAKGRIEYYIQAQDESGNITLRGTPTSPLRIMVGSPPALSVEGPVAGPIPPFPEKELRGVEEIPGPWYERWWATVQAFFRMLEGEEEEDGK